MLFESMLRVDLISILVLTMILSTPAWAQPEAGIVIVASGNVTANQEGQPGRALKRRSIFYTGDVIVVGEKGKAQVRFQDGTILSLTSGTRLRIDAFQYSGDTDNDNDTNIVTLLKGGFRTITGAVAKKNPAKHRVNTPVAKS